MNAADEKALRMILPLTVLKFVEVKDKDINRCGQGLELDEC
jgi:hypothetical protein